MTDLQTRIRGAVFETVVPKLRAMTADERSSLCEAAKPMAKRISKMHQDSLIAAGLAHHTLDGFALNELGKAAASIARNTPWLI